MSENKPLIKFTTDNKVIINGIEITNKNEWNRVLNHLEEYYKNFNKISTLLNYEQDKRIELENIIKEVRELAIIKKARVENEPDYSKSYLEGYENVIQTQHLTHSGVMLEAIKSTIKTTCNDFLEILDKEK